MENLKNEAKQIAAVTAKRFVSVATSLEATTTVTSWLDFLSLGDVISISAVAAAYAGFFRGVLPAVERLSGNSNMRVKQEDAVTDERDE